MRSISACVYFSSCTCNSCARPRPHVSVCVRMFVFVCLFLRVVEFLCDCVFKCVYISLPRSLSQSPFVSVRLLPCPSPSLLLFSFRTIVAITMYLSCLLCHSLFPCFPSLCLSLSPPHLCPTLCLSLLLDPLPLSCAHVCFVLVCKCVSM